MTDRDKFVKDLSKPIIDAAHSAVAELLADSEGVSAKIKETADQVLNGANDVFGNALKKGAELIKKHPVESMVAGFGIGCLVGLLLQRRN